MKITLKNEGTVIFTLTTDRSKTLDEVIALSPLEAIEYDDNRNLDDPDYTLDGEDVWYDNLSVED